MAYVNQAWEFGINPHSHTWLPYLTPNGVIHNNMPLADIKILQNRAIHFTNFKCPTSSKPTFWPILFLRNDIGMTSEWYQNRYYSKKRNLHQRLFYEFSRASLTPLGRVFTIRQNVLHGFATKNARLHTLNYRANRTQSNLFELLRCSR